MNIKHFTMTREQALRRLAEDPEFKGADVWDTEQIFWLTGSKKALQHLRKRYPEAIKNPNEH